MPPNTSWPVGCDIFLLRQQTSSELSGSRLPSELRFSCRQPHILLIKILIEDYEHYFVKQFHRPAAVNLQRPHGSSVVHRARAGNHHRLWWFCWFISNTALSPFTDIPLLKPKEPALQRVYQEPKWSWLSTSLHWWGRRTVPLQLLLT